MALNTLKFNHLMPLPFKGLTRAKPVDGPKQYLSEMKMIFDNVHLCMHLFSAYVNVYGHCIINNK